MFGSFVFRPGTGPDFPGPMGGLGAPNAWQSMNPQNLGPSGNVGLHGFSNQFPPRSGDATIPSTPVSGKLYPEVHLVDRPRIYVKLYYVNILVQKITGHIDDLLVFRLIQVT